MTLQYSYRERQTALMLRLDPSCNTTMPAGYRVISLNLRLRTHFTIHLGLDFHVCYLQAVLIEFAKAKARWLLTGIIDMCNVDPSLSGQQPATCDEIP